jgi:hypothetical protein
MVVSARPGGLVRAIASGWIGNAASLFGKKAIG